MKKPLTNEQFIERSRLIHGDKYDYSKAVYVNNRTKVIITCSIHGDFQQIPNSHLQAKNGCPICAGNARYDTKSFIDKAQQIHGNKYNYSAVDYQTAHIKVVIKCPKHGSFKQSPNAHLSGSGCFKCSILIPSNTTRSNTSDFVKKAKELHGDKYSYQQVNYINNYIKVRITCPHHGEFTQSPANHLKRNGCPRCKASKGEEVIAQLLEENNIEFVREYKLPEVEYNFKYDFYLPALNILIEFHGVQHYKSIPFFGGEEALKSNRFRDACKRVLAKETKRRLITVNYRQLEKDEKEFKQFLLKKIK